MLELEKDLTHALYQISRKTTILLNERLTELELYSSQFVLLNALRRIGPCTQSDLSKYLSIEPAAISNIIRRLEKGDWISKTKGTDRRKKIISLSTKAQKNTESLDKVDQDMLSQMYQGISLDKLQISLETLLQIEKNVIYQIKKYQ
ncbi:hypothetical protein BK708_39455 [Bacillus thuringiensis serovar yunnanensis]|nr:hypothetical protein BK708_39455 [Bacillus thuringiensis serovar yunnanensis]